MKRGGRGKQMRGRMLRRIRWWRIALAAVVVEAVLPAIAVLLNLSATGRAALLVGAIPLCVVGTFFGGWWVAR